MPTLSGLLPYFLAAALVLSVRVLAGLGRGRLSPPAADGAATLGIAAGFVAALFVLHVRPTFPLEASGSAWEWVFWFVPLGAVLGIAEGCGRAPRAVRGVVRLAVGAGAAWLIVREIHPRWIDDASRWQRVAIAAVVIAGLWTALAVAADPVRRRALAVSTIVAAAAAAVVLLRVGRSGVVAQAMAALAVVSAAAAAPLSRAGGVGLPTSAAPLIALVLGGLTVAGFPTRFADGHADFRLPTAVLLALAPAAGWLVPRRATPAVAAVLSALAALVVVAAAVVAGGIGDAMEPAPDGP